MNKQETALETAVEEEYVTPRRQAAEPLDVYLREVESHKLLDRVEEKELLKRLVKDRDAWVTSFLHSEGALEQVWTDIQAWHAKEISGASLIPGPPRLKPGQIGPDDHLKRLQRLFDKYVSFNGARPFHYRLRRRSLRLVRAILFVGMRPRPLDRYREGAIERHGKGLAERVQKTRSQFDETRRPLVERNLRLVLKVAWGYVPGPMTFDELIQEGNVGLIRAAESFNRRFNVRFSTYAYLWIKQSIIRALEEKSRMIRLPVHLTHLLRKVNRERKEGEELPEVVRYQGKRYRLPKLMANPTVTSRVMSLDVSKSDGDSGLAETIRDKHVPLPEEGALRGDLSAFVKKSLKALPERLHRIVGLRFGIGHKRPHTLGEIGEILGVSSERIRQLQEEALQFLREGPHGKILKDLGTS